MNRKNGGDSGHFVTCGQMKLLEQRADADGLSYYQMMENAGVQAAQMIRQCCEEPADEREELDLSNLADRAAKAAKEGRLSVADNVRLPESADHPLQALIFCGSGNNGGDGFVVARILAEAGYQVSVVLINGEPKTDDATTNFRLLEELPVNILFMTETESGILEQKKNPDLLVDAMFGTGFHGELRGSALKAALYINSCRQRQGTKVFALDIPSGLGGDQLRPARGDRQIVQADYTITFHARKPVHLQTFAGEYCGTILVADIGIEEERLMSVEI